MRVLYADIDGTLTRNGSLLHGEHGPSAAAAQALVRLHEAGVEIVPCTGRRVKEMGSFARLIGARTFLAELGAVLGLDGGHTTALTYAPPGGVPAGRALLEAGIVAELLGKYAGRLEIHEPWAREREHTVLLRGLVDDAEMTRILPPGVVLCDNGPIDKPADSKLFVPEVRSYHLTVEAVSKAHGVRFDLARRGLAPTDAAFVGDSAHDAEMAGVVGRVVILGERAEGVEHVARRYGEGFAEAVDMLLRRA